MKVVVFYRLVFQVHFRFGGHYGRRDVWRMLYRRLYSLGSRL